MLTKPDFHECCVSSLFMKLFERINTRNVRELMKFHLISPRKQFRRRNLFHFPFRKIITSFVKHFKKTIANISTY